MTTTTLPIIRRLAGATLAAFILVAALAAPAGAADDAAGQYLIDTDTVRLDTDTGEFGQSGYYDGISFHASGNGKVSHYHDGKHIRAQVTGTLVGTNMKACGKMTVTFRYANMPSNIVSPALEYKHCFGDMRTLDVDSSPEYDVVRVTITGTWVTWNCGPFLNDGPTCDDGTPARRTDSQSGPTVYVGDAPDSLGTAQRLDSDVVRLTYQRQTIFDGRSTYDLTANDTPNNAIRSTVWGELYWSDVLLSPMGTGPADRVRLAVMWQFAEGPAQFWYSGEVRQGQIGYISGTSSRDYMTRSGPYPKVRHVRQVTTWIETADDDGPFVQFDPTLQRVKFGDA